MLHAAQARHRAAAALRPVWCRIQSDRIGESWPMIINGIPPSASAAYPTAAQANLPEIVTNSAPEQSMLPDRVLPLLKTQAWLAATRSLHTTPLVYRPLVGELIVTYVLDADLDACVCEEHLARWKLAEPDVYALALDHLRAKPWTPYPGIKGSGAGALLLLNGRDGFDATRMLLPELFTAFNAWTPGALVFGVPNRDFLVAFSDAAPRVFNQVRAQIEIDARTKPHPLTAQVLTISDGQIQLYLPAS